jgi:hypothetical protein
VKLTPLHAHVLRGGKVQGVGFENMVAHVHAGFDLLRVGYIRAVESGCSEITETGRLALREYEERTALRPCSEGSHCEGGDSS